MAHERAVLGKSRYAPDSYFIATLIVAAKANKGAEPTKSVRDPSSLTITCPSFGVSNLSIHIGKADLELAFKGHQTAEVAHVDYRAAIFGSSRCRVGIFKTMNTLSRMNHDLRLYPLVFRADRSFVISILKII
ncbi:hypothetical protein GQ53DRAFT_85316 [Thozetella sp. PMI_491]|nr:hypothetical protein GQ53DRAFT_85316 [Thozetella sp. PMI_491]